MNKSKFAFLLAAGAALALSPAQVAAQATGDPAAAQAAGKPGLLGVQIMLKPEGPEIVEMLPDRTAAAIGFKVGDVLVEAGGKPISQEVLQEYMKQVKAGDQVSFKVKRAGAVVDLTGNAVGAPEGAPAPAAAPQE
jgi:C-terminal processing protease CtpA/Prc